MIALIHAAVAIGLIALAGLFGGMVFFGAVTTRVVFRTLGQPAAGDLIRALFPHYYRFTAIAAVLAAFGLLAVAPWCAIALWVVFLATLWLWRVLLPRMEGVQGLTDRRAFSRLHRISLTVNQIELLIALAVLVRVSLLMGGHGLG